MEAMDRGAMLEPVRVRARIPRVSLLCLRSAAEDFCSPARTMTEFLPHRASSPDRHPGTPVLA